MTRQGTPSSVDAACMSMQIGFIGLGAMGLPMTRHLLAAGHDVTVASRSRRRSTPRSPRARGEGADPRAVVAASEITILCVPDSPDVVEVIDAALPALGPGKIVVDTSTIDPEVEREHARTGRGDRRRVTSTRRCRADRSARSAARSPSMVGGDAAVLDAARPALEPFAALDRARGRSRLRSGREALQPARVRRADARGLRGVRARGEGGRRPRRRPRGHDPRDRRLQRDPHAHPVRRRAPRHSGVERMEARLHDRADGQGRRSRAAGSGACGRPRVERRAGPPVLAAAVDAGLRPRRLLRARQDRPRTGPASPDLAADRSP